VQRWRDRRRCARANPCAACNRRLETMALLTVSISDASPAFDKKSSEIAYILRCLAEVEKELGRGNGTVTSGTILTYTTGLNSPTAAGSWTYTPAASNP